jgi:hypothetical protein
MDNVKLVGQKMRRTPDSSELAIRLARITMTFPHGLAQLLAVMTSICKSDEAHW